MFFGLVQPTEGQQEAEMSTSSQVTPHLGGSPWTAPDVGTRGAGGVRTDWPGGLPWFIADQTVSSAECRNTVWSSKHRLRTLFHRRVATAREVSETVDYENAAAPLHTGLNAAQRR